MNDILKAALQAKYGMTRKEVIDRIEQAKEQGKLLELYECAMLKFEMAMQEMQHADNWYDWTEKYGEELKAVMPLSAEDTEKWEACKRKYADKIAIIKYMLDR